MEERPTTPPETLEFDDPAAAGQLFGPHNAHLSLLASASGAKITTRGLTLFLECPDARIRRILCALFLQMYELARRGTPIGGQDMAGAYAMLAEDPGADLRRLYEGPASIVTPRKTVVPRNAAQKAYLEALNRHEMVFGIGPAGTGKTYLAVAMALSMLRQKRVGRIVLTRPAVEAGERLGFLPGDLAEKVNPYLRPLYDALHDMAQQARVASMLETGTIEVAPLAFMRGRTLNDAFIILDEAQNTTREQMKMFLTRMGFGSRVVITGDITQIDLPAAPDGREERSGLVHALRLLEGLPGLAVHRFRRGDVVRHPLVGAIVDAYDSAEKKVPAL